MSTHTPGPWTDHGNMATLDGTPLVQSARRLVARMPGTTNTDKANARLIAAAPEMDALLKRVAHDVEQWPGKREHNMALNAVSEFIAKAEEGS